MVSGELTIIVNSCMIRSTTCQNVIQAVLYARVGSQIVYTQPLQADRSKQFSWEDKLLMKFTNESILHVWLAD